MSIKIAKLEKKSIVEKLTDKFEKDVERFFVWAVKKDYELKNSNDESIEWSIDLLKTIDFKEPGRNKLESLIKSIRQTYNIFLNEIEIDDAKLMSKDFKESPVEKSPKKVKEVKPKKSTKKIKNEDVKSEDVELHLKHTDKDVKSEVKPTDEDAGYKVRIDMTLDTENTFWLDTLEYWTKDLIKVFGKPKKTGSDQDDHLYEWKIQVNNTIYTIYDWHNKEKLEDITWHLGTNEENEDDFKVLIKYIDEIICKQDIKLNFENLDEE